MLYSNISTSFLGVVAMQMETLEAVHKESKRLPPITKVWCLSEKALSNVITLQFSKAKFLLIMHLKFSTKSQ